MRVTYKQDGGLAYFPGLNAPFVLDSSTMTTADGKQLQHLIAACDFFDLPISTAHPKGADMQRYTVTVEDGKRKHTVHLADPIDTPALQALIDFVQAARQSGTSSAA